LIIPNAVIASAPEFVDAGMDTSVTVLISKNQVQILVQAMRDGLIDLVAIPVAGNSS
jgi:FixJ family two-component response regulator